VWWSFGGDLGDGGAGGGLVDDGLVRGERGDTSRSGSQNRNGYATASKIARNAERILVLARDPVPRR
jgi:hypothetical protein